MSYTRRILPYVRNIEVPVGESQTVVFPGTAVSLRIQNTGNGIAEIQLDDQEAFGLASQADVQFSKDDLHISTITVTAPPVKAGPSQNVNFYGGGAKIEVLIIAGVTE